MNKALLESRITMLKNRDGADEHILNEIHQFLLDRVTYGRIYPHQLADQLDQPINLVINELLYGVAEGVFDLHWDIRCPHCGGLVKNYAHLEDALHQEHCPRCVVDYDVDFSSNVEVTFSLNNEIYDDDAFVDIDRPEGITVLTGLDMMHYPTFRAIFRDETLSTREQLKITAVTLLFTDITGSTQMYERLGDSVAYNIVRDHFDILFSEIEAHNGIVIKTIGDAVMASFRSNDDAVRCILNGMGRFEEYNQAKHLDHQVRIKIGLHRGPAILVTLNDRLDYFGSTVNKAARIQGYAKSDELLISKEVYDTPGIKEAIKSYPKMAIRSSKLDLKGLDGQHLVYSLTRDTGQSERAETVWQKVRQAIGF